MIQEKAAISVVVPTYNVQDYLRQCLESLSNQPDVAEIVVIDDGSTDRTVEIARSIAASDSRIMIVVKEHEGVSAARNTGIGLVSSPFIAFVDSDDTVPPGAFGSLLEAARQLESDMTYGDFSIFRDGRIESSISEFSGFHGSLVPPHYMISSLASTGLGSVSGSCWRILFRTEFLHGNSIAFPRGIAMSEDYYFILDCLRANPSVSYINQCVYIVRRGSVSATQRFMPSLEIDMQSVNAHLRVLCEGDSSLMVRYNDCVANTAWYACRNLFKYGSPYSFSARRVQIKEICQRNRDALRSVGPLSSMPRAKATLLRVAGRSPEMLWLLLELVSIRSKDRK